MASPTLYELVARHAAASPDRPALVMPGRPALSYRGLAEQFRGVADALAGLGIGKGDVVLVSLPNGPGLAVALLGTACAATAAPLAVAATAFEAERLVDEMNVKAVVVAAGIESPLRRLADERGLPTLELNDDEVAREVIASPATAAVPCVDAADVALLMHTSGTTARPKLVPLTHASLVGSAERVVDSVRLGPDDCCLNVMPLVHAHGLIGGLLSTLAAGGSALCAGVFDPREALASGRECGATWTTAAPAIYHALADAEGPRPRFRFMRSASAPMPTHLAELLEDRFQAPLIEVYGMTEAYQIAANPLPPGERRSGSVGLPTGTEVAVVDDSGAFLDAGAQGEIALRGPGVFAGYRGPQELNDRAFVDGWFRTGDLGELGQDGYLNVTGRIHEVINRGGEKIAPREVEEALAQHAGVREAVCFPVADFALGEEIGALIVPSGTTNPQPGELRRFLASRLAPSKIPRWFRFGNRIPVNKGGKLNRLELAKKIGFPSWDKPHEAPSSVSSTRSTKVREELRALWMELLALDRLPRDEERFFDLGGTSLGLVELLVEVERRFGVRLQLESILEAPSVREMAERIETGAAAGPAPPGRIEVEREEFTASVVPIRASGARRPLFFVSPAGGSVLPFYRLADALGPEQPLFGLEVALHRRGAGVRLEIGDLASAFLEGVRRVQSRGPWSIGGWSFGGFVAWELASLLRDGGETVSHVVFVDSDASALGRPPSVKGVVQGMGQLARMVWYSKPFLRDAMHVRFAASRRGKRKLGPLRRAIASVLWKAGVERADIARHVERDPRLLEVGTASSGAFNGMLPFVRAARCHKATVVCLDIDLIRAGLDRPGTPGPGAKADVLGWDRYATGEIRVHPMAGNHFTVLGNAHVDELAGIIERVLTR